MNYRRKAEQSRNTNTLKSCLETIYNGSDDKDHPALQSFVKSNFVASELKGRCRLKLTKNSESQVD